MYTIGLADQLLAKHFPGVPYPPLLELEKDVALGLHFGHPLIMDGLRPTAPNYVYLGMMNCKDPKPLPTDLREFMDGAKDGVIYVSFGCGFAQVPCRNTLYILFLIQIRAAGVQNAR